jgi:hypothetical protein
VPHIVHQVSNGYFEDCVVVTSAGLSYLAVIKTSADGKTAEPWTYRLPRAEMSPANDPGVPKTVADKWFWTPRYAQPGREIQKTFRCFEFWGEFTGDANTVGFQVWAKVNDGAAFQLLDSTGQGATLKGDGFHRVFFPPTGGSVGNYVQLGFRVPVAAGQATGCAVDAIRDGQIRLSYRPTRARVVQAGIILARGDHQDRTPEQRTVEQQVANLETLAGPNSAPVPFRDPYGHTGYCTIETVKVTEMAFKGEEESQRVVMLTLREELYA